MLSTQSVLRVSAFTIATLALSFGVFLGSSFVAHAQVTPTCSVSAQNTGGGTQLTWNAYNAGSVYINHDIGWVNTNDSYYLGNITTLRTYIVTVYSGANGTGAAGSCQVTVGGGTYYGGNNVHGLPACTLTIQPDYVFANGSAVITYNASGATSAYIDGGVGQVYGNGTKTIYNVTSPRTYTMTVSNNNGTTSCADTVSVAGQASYYGGGTNYYNQQPYNYNYTYGNSYAYPTLGYQYPTNYPTSYPAYNNYTTPTYYQKQTSAYYPTATRSVHIAAVPYTGPADALYVAAMLALTLAIAFVLYRNRGVLRIA